MKPKFKIQAVVLWMLLALSSTYAFGQVPPANCVPNTNTTVPTLFKDWHWEYDLTDSRYCNMWTANLGVGNITTKTFMGAPWVFASSDFLMRIGTRGDYLPSNGWVLLRMDFGGNSSAVSAPYFVLYNKYTSVMRVFVYLAGTTSYTKVLMTLRHTTGNTRSTAVLGMINTLQAAPDKYLAQNSSDELMTYVCKYGRTTGWIMGEFTMSFDPNVMNPSFFESALQFNVYGVTTSNVDIGGSFKFTTQPQPEDGYGFSGSASQLQTNQVGGTKSFLAAGAKFLGQVGNWSDEISNFNQKADKAALSLSAAGYDKPSKQPLYAAYKLASFAQAKSAGGLAKTLKGIFDFAGSAAPALSLLGTVVGILWPDETQAQGTAPTVLAPTISSGTIKLTGTIETSVSLYSFSMHLPGTLHNNPNFLPP